MPDPSTEQPVVPTAPVVAPADSAVAPPGIPSAPTARRGLLVPFRHRDFAIFWSGAFVSNGGTWLQNVALAWLMLQITDSPFWVSMVTFTQFFPMVIFGLVGGLAADRLERRRVLIVTQSVMMLVAFLLAAIAFTGTARVGTILPVVAIGGIALAFNAPSFQALIPDLVPRENVLDAVSLNTAQFSAARVVGPLAGGIVLATVGAGWAFFANGVTFVAVLVALVLIRPPRQERPASSGARALLGGIRAMNATPVIRVIVTITAVVSLFVAPVIALLPVLARDVLAHGSGGYGALFAAFSAGAVAGALTTSRVVHRLGMRAAVTAGLVAMGASSLALSISRITPVSALVLAVVGFSYTATVSATNTGMQLSVPPAKRGRVMSLFMMSWAGLFPVGSVLAGVAATHVGVPLTLGVAAIPLLGAAAVVHLRGAALSSVRV